MSKRKATPSAVVVDAWGELEKFVAQHETASEAAVALGISGVYLSDIRHGRRDVPPRVLAQLGLARAVVRTESAKQREA